jgi:hypothetical protein
VELIVPMEHGRTVYLLDGLAMSGIHDAVHTIAQSCNLDVVMAGRIAGKLPQKLPPIRCDHALDMLVRWTQLEYENRGGGIVRIARRGELTTERDANATRTKRGVAADALPSGRDVDLDFERAPLRDVLALLAQAGGVELALPAGLDATVTVRARHLPWRLALVEVLAASGMGYRYQESGKQLRIAPVAELDAERARPAR